MKGNKFYHVYYTKDGIMYIYFYKTKFRAKLKRFFLKNIKSRKDYEHFDPNLKDFKNIKLSLQGTTTKNYRYKYQ